MSVLAAQESPCNPDLQRAVCAGQDRIQFHPLANVERAAANHYPTMPTEEIAALDVPAADDAVLFLWTRFADGRVGEVFLSNHKSNSSADVNARDAAIVFSIAVQCGADLDVIRRALCRDSRGNASGPLAAALDKIVEADGGAS